MAETVSKYYDVALPIAQTVYKSSDGIPHDSYDECMQYEMMRLIFKHINENYAEEPVDIKDLVLSIGNLISDPALCDMFNQYHKHNPWHQEIIPNAS
jgi:hypothetical protein